MRLTPDQVKEAILHPDVWVREAALYYFTDCYSPDATVMPLAIRAIETYGFHEAFGLYETIVNLEQTAETVRWLIQLAESSDMKPPGEQDIIWIDLVPVLVSAEPDLLQAHRDEIAALDDPDCEDWIDVDERISFASHSPDDLWRELELYCQDDYDEDEDEDKDKEQYPENFDYAERLVEALARHPAFCTEKVLSILRDDGGEHTMRMTGCTVQLAGRLRLEAAVAAIAEQIDGDDSWLRDECGDALVRIGSEAVVQWAAEAGTSARSGLRSFVAALLGDIHTDPSVRTGLNLLTSENDPNIQCELILVPQLGFRRSPGS